MFREKISQYKYYIFGGIAIFAILGFVFRSEISNLYQGNFAPLEGQLIVELTSSRVNASVECIGDTAEKCNVDLTFKSIKNNGPLTNIDDSVLTNSTAAQFQRYLSEKVTQITVTPIPFDFTDTGLSPYTVPVSNLIAKGETAGSDYKNYNFTLNNAFKVNFPGSYRVDVEISLNDTPYRNLPQFNLVDKEVGSNTFEVTEPELPPVYAESGEVEVDTPDIPDAPAPYTINSVNLVSCEGPRCSISLNYHRRASCTSPLPEVIYFLNRSGNSERLETNEISGQTCTGESETGITSTRNKHEFSAGDTVRVNIRNPNTRETYDSFTLSITDSMLPEAIVIVPDDMADDFPQDDDPLITNLTTQTVLNTLYQDEFLIKYKTNSERYVQISIYNSANQKIRTLRDNSNGFVPANVIQTITWNGKNDNGVIVNPGEYTYKLKSPVTFYGSFEITGRIHVSNESAELDDLRDKVEEEGIIKSKEDEIIKALPDDLKRVLELQDPVISQFIPGISATNVPIVASSAKVIFANSTFSFDTTKQASINIYKDGVPARDYSTENNISYSATTKTLTIPYSELAYNTKYWVLVPATAFKDSNKNPMSQNILWSFTTIAEDPDPLPQPPNYSQLIPADGATNVPTTAAIAKVIFSATTFTFDATKKADINIYKEGEPATDYSTETDISYDPATKTLSIPYRELTASTVYRVFVPSDAFKDSNNLAMNQNISWVFTTAGVTPPPNTCIDYSLNADHNQICFNNQWLTCNAGQTQTVGSYECRDGQWQTNVLPPPPDPGTGGITFPRIRSHKAFPESFNPLIHYTEITFALSANAKVEVKITTKSGERVATLINNDNLNQGEHTVKWYGTYSAGSSGDTVPGGEYEYIIKAKDPSTSTTTDTASGEITVLGGGDFEDGGRTGSGSNVVTGNSSQATVVLQGQTSGRSSETGPGILIYALLPFASYLITRKKNGK